MTPKEALQILEQVRSQFSATGADHDKIREAINVLSKTVNEKDTDSGGSR